MQVSFIIPLYNCLDLTQAMLASLQASMPKGLTHEIILVDDGSTDGTREWLSTLAPPFRVILNERNLGYAGATNRGAGAAQGELLALLNNDLVLPPRWFEPMLSVLRRLEPRAGLIGNIQRDVRTGTVDHAGIFINHKGKPEHDRRLPWWRALPGAWRRTDAVTGACVLVRRQLWSELGGFDIGYVNGCEDVDLCLRAAGTGRINAVSLRSVVRHHISASPGRKIRDEENTYRLALRWRDTLARLGAREWGRLYLENEWTSPRDPAEHVEARQILFHVYRLRRNPPPPSLRAMDAAINHEIARWRELLDGPPNRGVMTAPR